MTINRAHIAFAASGAVLLSLAACQSQESASLTNNRATTVLTAIPSEFQGRWARFAEECDPAHADGRVIQVGAEGVEIYGSNAVLQTAEAISPTRMKAHFTFPNDGKGKDMTFSLESNGEVLARTEHNPTATLRYAKCA